jgi:Tol biopolymer transport system component
MSQHTNGNVDDSFPVLSSDGKLLYFTRWTSSYGPSIWSLNKAKGTLSSCARGFDVCAIPGNNEAFYCVRNSTAGKSEIWYVNYVKGQESIVLSDTKRSFTSPCLSPDGKWLLVVGNSTSNISNKENTDIFVARTDGSQLTQLTYHPQTDMSPVWSKDGKYIYFISSRANADQAYNVWRMNFSL